jgi:hypothetical protein
MSGLRDVLLGATDSLIRPDATEDFSASIEPNVVCHARSGTLQPAGETGEATLRRIYLQGYHFASARMFVTPVIDGHFRTDLTKYVMLPAPQTGRLDRFSLVVPIDEQQPGYEGFSVSPRGAAFAVHVEIRAPKARVFLTSAVPYVEALNIAGAPKAE